MLSEVDGREMAHAKRFEALASAFALQQNMDTAITVPYPRLRDLFDPLLEVGLIGALANRAEAGSLSPQHAAGSPHAHLPRTEDIIDQLASPIRPRSVGRASLGRLRPRKTTFCNFASPCPH